MNKAHVTSHEDALRAFMIRTFQLLTAPTDHREM